jgi:hypothetical protein
VNDRSVLILVIGILIAIVLVVAGFVIPIFLTGGAGSRRPSPRPRTRVFADSPAGHLIVGFGYLYPQIDFVRSRGSVQRRMRRAIQRVDAVDPYTGARRIGSALLQAGLVDPGLPSPAEEEGVAWSSPEAESSWTPGTDEPEAIWEPSEAVVQPPTTIDDVPGLPSGAEGIWTQAEPEAEFPAPFDEPEASSFDRPRDDRSRDTE